MALQNEGEAEIDRGLGKTKREDVRHTAETSKEVGVGITYILTCP